jgi:hypothetical protein
VGPQVIRYRQLTPVQVHRIDALRSMARLLDSAFYVPGLNVRFGLDPIIGLFPLVGDLISPLFTVGILLQARELGLPRVVQMRMILNVAIDTFLGVVPVVGDLFDFAWKANERNMDLLERHAFEERPADTGDWLFVGAAVIVLVGIAVVPALLIGWLVASLVRWL